VIFLSYYFVLFVIVAIAAYYLAPRNTIRLVVLIGSSLVFHAHFAGPAGMLPIIVLAVVTYLCGLSNWRPLLVAAIALSAFALVFYKYTLFISDNVVALLGAAVDQSAYQAQIRPALTFATPLAISFFVFEFIHYLYDRIRGFPPIRNPLHFASFAIFWPSLVAGPIKRYETFLPILQKGTTEATAIHVVAGSVRVGAGILKKIASDNLTLFITFWSGQQAFFDATTKIRWIMVLAIALRIYFDFSGYSDMAIGYARMMGIILPENFNWPYLATSLTDFWNRWHISLSTWIRDYIYIPLGGSRQGTARRAVNLAIAFALCGLWHGANWNFIVWGLYHGAGVAICSTYRKLPFAPVAIVGFVMSRIPGVAWSLTMAYVTFGWILFFYPLPRAFEIVTMLFTPHW
jgi:alginate O-acetyltransferase complex protein AlgI